MKKLAWFVCSLTIVMMTCGPAAARADKAEKAEKAKARKAKSSGLRGEYGIMAGVLKFDKAQKAKLIEALEINKTAKRQWAESDEGKKMQELSQAHAKARKDGDKEKTKSLAAELKKLKKSQAKVVAEGKTRIMAVLTDEQKKSWAAFGLERRAMRLYKKLDLTDAQRKQIKDLCAEAIKNRPADADKKAIAKADKQLMSDIAEKVLTDAQREQLSKPAEKPKQKKKDQDPAKKTKEAT